MYHIVGYESQKIPIHHLQIDMNHQKNTIKSLSFVHEY